MQEDLLSSVVNITNTRDVDSLEYSLATTLQEFLEPKEVIIYRKSKHLDNKIIIKTLHFDFGGKDPEINHNKVTVVKPEAELVTSFDNKTMIEKVLDNREIRWFPIKAKSDAIGCVCIISNPLNGFQITLANALCRIYENFLFMLYENERDKLTGLLNRQTFDIRLEALMNKQHRLSKDSQAKKSAKNMRQSNEGAVSWLVMIDIDHFKQVNDNHGHICGDEVLLRLAQIMTRFFRDTDLLFRFGGEEFVIVFEPASEQAIAARLDQFLEHVRLTQFPFVEQLTVSIGYARMTPRDYPITVLDHADKALYFAKNNGRNQVVSYEQMQAQGKTQSHASHGDIDLF